MPDDYEPDSFTPRNSLDSTTNTYGNLLLNLTKNNQLVILNGRTLGDLTGNFTSIQKNGCSVIDYFAVTNKLKPNINYLKVLQFTEFSDHRPLSIELHCKRHSTQRFGSLQDNYEAAPCRYIFNDDNKGDFCDIQSEEPSVNIINKLLTQIDVILNSENEKSEVEKTIRQINDRFTEHIRDMASKCFKKTKPPKDGMNSNKPWFNWRTRSAKREFRKATDSTNKFPSSDFLRKNFYRVKHSYKKNCQGRSKYILQKHEC